MANLFDAQSVSAFHVALHKALVWAGVLLVFVSDFFTPLGFAHGVLYLPVMIYALILPGLSDRFQITVLVVALIATALVYVNAPNVYGIPRIQIISNRILTGAILVLTYVYLRKLRSLNLISAQMNELEESQHLTVDNFIDAMPVQVWLANAKGEVDYVSSSLESFVGKSKEVILADWLAVLHPDDRERTIAVWTISVQTGKPYRLNFRLRRHDGEYIWFQTQALAQYDESGQIKRWVGSSADINDLRRFREESERLAARFRHTVESITDAFFTLDHEFRFTYLNQRTADTLGNTIDELLGEVIWDKCGVGYDSPFSVQYRRAAQTKEKHSFQEFYAPRGLWLEVHIYPSPDGLTVYFSDITQRLEMEQRLRESQKLETVGHLTGGVAHDFNNLLTVIMGNAEVMAANLTDPNLKSMANMTLQAAERGSELTSRLLAFARRRPLKPTTTNINHLVEGMRALIRRTLPENIDVQFVLSNAQIIAKVDAGELDTALLNLVLNARDAMPTGGKLTIETAVTELDTDYAQRHPDVEPGEYVVVCVSDNGVGMSAATVERAYEPFFTTKEVGKGSGLGLSMVFGFTKQSGGHFKLYSELEEGTSVKLYFPLEKDEQALVGSTTAKSEPKRGTEHILIAEDDELVLQHLERQLTSLGYRVTTAMSGAQALAALQNHSDIDLLLTDIIMPGGMNGRELSDQARARFPALKVLFTSGYTENAINHNGKLDPGVELLNKPYTRLELANTVRRILDLERSRA